MAGLPRHWTPAPRPVAGAGAARQWEESCPVVNPGLLSRQGSELANIPQKVPCLCPGPPTTVSLLDHSDVLLLPLCSPTALSSHRRQCNTLKTQLRSIKLEQIELCHFYTLIFSFLSKKIFQSSP